MRNLITPGRIMFAVGIMALGVLQFIVKDYIVGRPPAPEWAAEIPGKLSWAYTSAIILILLGLSVIFSRRAGIAALLISIMIFICSFFLRYLPGFFHAKWEDILWSINAYKSLALAGGGLIVAASCFEQTRGDRNQVFSNQRLIITGIILLALFLIICGLAHFKFVEFVNPMVPAYMPGHTFWTYFAAIALLAGGIGIVLPPTRKWAALLAGIMILLWFFMVHIPRALATPREYGEWMGVCESFAFSGIFFVLAGLSSANSGSKSGMR